MRIFPSLPAFLVALLVLITGGTRLRAQIIHFASDPGLAGIGAYSGYFEYVPISATAGAFSVSLQNSSLTEAGGKLVAFAFNNPSGLISTASLSSGPSAWSLLGSQPYNNGIAAQPFGKFDIGAASTTSWQGGGSPNQGILVGNSATFTFMFGGVNLSSLTTQSFVSALNSTQDFFAVRFRGFDSGRSDKVTAYVVDEFPPIPEPSTYGFLGVMALSAVVAMRKRASKAKPLTAV